MENGFACFTYLFVNISDRMHLSAKPPTMLNCVEIIKDLMDLILPFQVLIVALNLILHENLE